VDISFINRASALLGVPLLSGTNFFLTIAAIGSVEYFTDFTLPGMEFLARPGIILLACGIYLVETLGGAVINTLTPSVPVDTAKETLKSFFIIPATAVLMGMMGSGGAAPREGLPISAGLAAEFDLNYVSIIYFIAGGVLCSFAQSLKIFVRSVIDLLPEPLTNLGVELMEGATSVAGILLLFFAPWVLFAFSGLFLIFFLLAGPRILRTARLNVKAVFAAGSHYFKKEDTVLNPQKAPPELIKKAAAHFEKTPPPIARFISQRVPAMGVNFTGHVFLAEGKLCFAARGILRKKSFCLPEAHIDGAKLYPGLLTDHLYISVAGEKNICVKFLKTWKKDSGLLLSKLPLKAETEKSPVTQAP